MDRAVERAVDAARRPDDAARDAARASTAASLQSRHLWPIAVASQHANKRRIERLIRLAAPALDLVLFAGDRVSRVVGRNELPPDPVRRAGLPPATRD